MLSPSNSNLARRTALVLTTKLPGLRPQLPKACSHTTNLHRLHTLATSTFVFDDCYTLWRGPPLFSMTTHTHFGNFQLAPQFLTTDSYTHWLHTLGNSTRTISAKRKGFTNITTNPHFTSRLSIPRARSPQRVHRAHPNFKFHLTIATHTISAKGSSKSGAPSTCIPANTSRRNTPKSFAQSTECAPIAPHQVHRTERIAPSAPHLVHRAGYITLSASR